VSGSQIIIDTQPVSFVTSKSPVLVAQTSSPLFISQPFKSGADTGYNLSWTVNIGVDDSGDPIDWSATVVPSDLKLSCQSKTISLSPGPITATPRPGPGNGGALTLQLGFQTHDSDEAVDINTSQQCTLTGNLKFAFPARGGATPHIIRALPSGMNLRYPKALDQSSVAAHAVSAAATNQTPPAAQPLPQPPQ
jgi:hypothetical protein